MSIQEYILAGSKFPIHNHYQLRLTRLEDVLGLLRVYLGCNCNASLELTIPMRLASVPRLGDRSLLMRYLVVLGLREDNLGDMAERVTIRVGRVRSQSSRKRSIC